MSTSTRTHHAVALELAREGARALDRAGEALDRAIEEADDAGDKETADRLAASKLHVAEASMKTWLLRMDLRDGNTLSGGPGSIPWPQS